MKKLLKVLSSILLVPTLVACDGGTLWADGEYEVIWIDSEPPYLAKCDSKVDMCQGITGEPILAVGNNERHIVAEFQKINGGTSFYIIEKSESSETKLLGPYNREQYQSKSLELKLPEFSKRF